MMHANHSPMRNLARDISYSSSASTRAGKAVIRSVENLTGRLKLIRMAKNYEAEIAAGRDFWEVMMERYGLRLDVIRGTLDSIPKTGPTVVMSNHPYGILDGMMMGRILSQTRGEFRILAHQVFRKAKELEDVVLPISFDDSREARAVNLATRKEALRFLSDGGCIGIFPGGGVSTALKPFGYPMDPEWRKFSARLISKSKATVVPIFYDGHNSRLFQVASHISTTLRMALLVKEFKMRVGGPVEVAIGDPFTHEDLKQYERDAGAMMDFLRTATYRLSPKPLKDLGYGFDWVIPL